MAFVNTKPFLHLVMSYGEIARKWQYRMSIKRNLHIMAGSFQKVKASLSLFACYSFSGAAAPCSGAQGMYKLHAAAFALLPLYSVLHGTLWE